MSTPLLAARRMVSSTMSPIMATMPGAWSAIASNWSSLATISGAVSFSAMVSPARRRASMSTPLLAARRTVSSIMSPIMARVPGSWSARSRSWLSLTAVSSAVSLSAKAKAVFSRSSTFTPRAAACRTVSSAMSPTIATMPGACSSTSARRPTVCSSVSIRSSNRLSAAAVCGSLSRACKVATPFEPLFIDTSSVKTVVVGLQQ